MARVTTKGKCKFCQQEFAKAGMTKHLTTCPARLKEAETAKKGPAGRLLHLVVEGRDAPMYWMHLEISADTTLIALDDFLRAKWLECCGHLSAFQIGGVNYDVSSDPDGF